MNYLNYIRIVKLIKTVFWDFDGVILDSMPIRDYGFAKIFEDFDKSLIDKLLEYHTLNGGLSRYVKIRYFYNTLLNQEVSNEKVQNAINLLNLYNKKITMNSVANEAGMSYNTVKKYKQIIENAENNRTKGV